MPKSLVIPLDDETYRQFKKYADDNGETLKDAAYETIKETGFSWECFQRDQEDERRKQEEAKSKVKIVYD